MKFKFNYLESSLAYQTEAGNTWYQITEQFTGSFGSLGFSLSEGWMTFTVQTSQIRVFYKQVKEANSSFWKSRNAVYFKKALANEQLARINEVLRKQFRKEVYEEEGYLKVRRVDEV